jgi:hypothetical protein
MKNFNQMMERLAQAMGKEQAKETVAETKTAASKKSTATKKKKRNASAAPA